MTRLAPDEYTKIVEWSDEDNCYVGSVPELCGPCCHGDDKETVYRELCEIVDEWVEILANDPKLRTTHARFARKETRSKVDTPLIKEE